MIPKPLPALCLEERCPVGLIQLKWTLWEAVSGNLL